VAIVAFRRLVMQYLRTNNDVEGWHPRLIRLKVAKAGINFYALLPLLLSELKLIQFYIELLCQNQTLQERRNVAKCTQNNLMDAWERAIAMIQSNPFLSPFLF